MAWRSDTIAVWRPATGLLARVPSLIRALRIGAKAIGVAPILARLTLAALIGGLASPSQAETHVPVAIDGAFKGQHYDDIRHAVEQWNIALAHRVVFDIQPGRYVARRTEGTDNIRLPGVIFLRIDSEYPMVQGPQFRQTLAVAVGSVRSGMVYVLIDRVDKRHLSGVTMHEVGHILGVSHLQKGLMEPRYNPRAHRCIDAMTMAAVAQAQGVVFDKLDWCY